MHSRAVLSRVAPHCVHAACCCRFLTCVCLSAPAQVLGVPLVWCFSCIGCHMHDARTQRGCALHYSGRATVHLQHSVYTVSTALSCVHSRALFVSRDPRTSHPAFTCCRLFVWCRSPSGFLRCLPLSGGYLWEHLAPLCFLNLLAAEQAVVGCTYGTGRPGVTRRTTTSRRCSSRRRAQSLTARRSFSPTDPL